LHGLSTLKGPLSLLWIVERLAGGWGAGGGGNGRFGRAVLPCLRVNLVDEEHN